MPGEEAEGESGGRTKKSKNGIRGNFARIGLEGEEGS